MRVIKYGVLISCLLIVCFAIWVYTSLHMSSVKEEKIFSIPPRASVQSISESLESQGLIPNAFMFRLLVKITGEGRKIRAGDYLLTAQSSPVDILELFVSGAMYMISVTIPEGLPWWEVALRFEKEGLVTFDDFRTLVYDKEFLMEQQLPFSSAEGFLYPETYHFVKPVEPSRSTTRNVIATMISMFNKQTKNIFPRTMSEKEKYDTIILASIVEKEAQQKEERARIAGVYINRININMILQADPTIIYGLGQGFEGRLRKRHLLDASNPYNTYKIRGLTPTPICSPSKEVIEAVLYPEKHEYLYFVAMKKDGRHFFSETLEEHNKAVQKYQLGKSTQ